MLAAPTQTGLTGYTIKWVPAPDQIYTAAEESTTLTDATATSTRITGLVATVEYEVTVQADFSSGPSGSAAKSSPSDPVAVAASWTTRVFVTAPGFTAFTELQWKLSSESAWEDTDRLRVASNPVTVDKFVLGEEYDFRLRYWTVNGPGAWAERDDLLVAFKPDAPLLDSVTSGNASVVASWSAPVFVGGSAITDYVVQWKSGIEEFTDNERTAAASSTSMTIGSLTNGKLYRVRVLARNAVADSSPSAARSTTPATAPSAPQDVVLTSGDRRVSVSWDAPASDGGSAVTGYEVQYRVGTDGTWSISNVSVSGTGATITGLTNGTSYQVQVWAVNASKVNDCEGPWSSARSGRPATVPSVPENVSITTGDATLTVAWDAPASTGGSAVTGYEVQYRTGSGAWSTSNVSVSGRTATITGLVNGSSYEVQVRAVNASKVNDGEGPWSSARSGRPATVPAEPQNVLVTSGRRALTVSWDAPDNNGGSAVTGYEVEYRVGTSRSGRTSNVTVTGRSADITGLSENSTYNVRVRALNESNVNNGKGVWSQSAPGTPDPPDPPSVPTNVRMTPSGSARFEFSWEAPDDDGGDDVNEYELEWRTRNEGYGDFWDRPRWRSQSGTSRSIHSLKTHDHDDNRLVYEGRVRAVNDGGAGDWASTTGQPGLKPRAPESVKLEVVGDNKIKVTWDAVAHENGSTPSDYVIHYTHSDWSGRQEGTAEATATEFTTESLDPADSSWRFRVAARSDWGTGLFSAIVKAKPYATPSVPTGVHTVANDSELVVAWTTGTEDDEGVASSKLRRRVQGGSDSDWTTVEFSRAHETAHVLTGLTNGTVYEVQVAAVNPAGAGEWSATVTGMPTATTAPALTVTFTPDRYNRIDVYWEWTDSTSYPVDGFRIRWRKASQASYPAESSASVEGTARYYAKKVETERTYVVEVAAMNGTTVQASRTSVIVLNTAREIVEERLIPSVETNDPWTRTVWDALGVSVHEVNSPGILGIVSQYITSDRGWPVTHSARLSLAPSVLNDYSTKSSRWAFFHEMGHMLQVRRDSLEHRPAIGVMWLYTARFLGGECNTIEVYADIVSAASGLQHSNETYNHTYYPGCSVTTTSQPTDEQVAVAKGAVTGVLPTWFTDTYEDSDGTIKRTQLWNDFRAPGLKDARAYYFAEAFGGFCSYREARGSWVAGRDSTIPNEEHTDDPWVEGGCHSFRPSNVQVVAGDGSLDLSWEAPLWTKEPNLNGYLVQWKAPGEEYDGSRQTLLNGLTSLATTISGLTNDTTYTIRLAAVKTSDRGLMVHKNGHKRYVEITGTPTT